MQVTLREEERKWILEVDWGWMGTGEGNRVEGKLGRRREFRALGRWHGHGNLEQCKLPGICEGEPNENF